MIVSSSSNGYTSQTIACERTSSIDNTMTTRTMSAVIMTRLRLMRSFTTPAVGPIKV